MATAEEILAKLKEIQASVDEIPALLQIAPRQIITITGLSDIDQNLGLIKAGEFRSGNNRQPGEGFSGIRIAFPSMRYPSTSVSASDLWNLAGVDADRLMVGIRSSDGTFVAGAGRMEVDVTGLAVEETGFVSADFDTGERYFRIFNANYSERLSLNTYNPIASGTDWFHQGSMFFRAGNISDSATRPFPAIGMLYYYLTADTSIASTNTVGLSTSLRQWGFTYQMDASSDNTLRMEAIFIENGAGDSGQFDIGFTNAGRFASGSSQTAWVINWPHGRQPFFAVTSDESQIWIDTAGEVRLGDTAASGSTSWYLPKSASTAGGMTRIAQYTLTNAGAFSITGISSAYETLKIVGFLRSAVAVAADYFDIYLNGDNAANYDAFSKISQPTATDIDYAVAGSTLPHIAAGPGASAPAGNHSNVEITIPGYSRTTITKTAHGRAAYMQANSTAGGRIFSGLVSWRSTAAITSIEITSNSTTNFSTDSIITLYGIS